MCIQLTAAGMFCDTAPNGPTALRMLTDAALRAPYGIVVLDHHMPGMDGRELARIIKSDPLLRRTRLVMLGSVTRALDADDLRAIGVVGFCTKPVWRKQLLDVLRRALAEGAPQSSDPPTFDGSSRPGSTARILLVEDSPINAEVAGEILRAAGYAFDLVTDGLAAIEAAEQKVYDLVLMDCQLPEVDGYEATRRIRTIEREGRLPAGPRAGKKGALPIIALTASVAREDLDRCLQAGMNDHLPKPVDARRLIATVERHLGYASPDLTGDDSPASERPSGLPVANLSRAFARMRGDRALLRRVSKQFAEGAPDLRGRLRSAVQRRDAQALAYVAHLLRGQAGSFDGEACMAAITVLEEAASRESWTAAAAALLAVEAELDRLLRAIVAEDGPLTAS